MPQRLPDDSSPNLTVLSTPSVLTMSSHEIAELTGTMHKNVLEDIRKMLDSLGLAAADFSATAFVAGPNNSTRPVQVVNLPKRETMILVFGYSVVLRAGIVDRWMELQEATAICMEVMQIGHLVSAQFFG
jgi:phage regulator Rha-like protein